MAIIIQEKDSRINKLNSELNDLKSKTKNVLDQSLTNENSLNHSDNN
jgi:hypothetical protein